MADKQQLDTVISGLTPWNVWRQNHPDVNPDLSNANLSSQKLSSANLSSTNLSSTNLSRAVLSNATLSKANLSNANLSSAILVRADLVGADLTGANLSYANLIGANLNGADLTGTRVAETVFGDTDLRNAIGLDSCVHVTPSTIDHRTLTKSAPLPLAFVRGVGLPDSLIDRLPFLFGEDASQYYACFISYSSHDEPFAKQLHADLQNNKVRCWFAPDDLRIGAHIRTDIDEAIRSYDKLLLILSQHSVTSPWVKIEVESALEQEQQTDNTILFPIRLDDAVMTAPGGWPEQLRNSRSIGDMRQWKDRDAYQKAFARLLRDLRATQAAPAQ